MYEKKNNKLLEIIIFFRVRIWLKTFTLIVREIKYLLINIETISKKILQIIIELRFILAKLKNKKHPKVNLIKAMINCAFVLLSTT